MTVVSVTPVDEGSAAFALWIFSSPVVSSPDAPLILTINGDEALDVFGLSDGGIIMRYPEDVNSGDGWSLEDSTAGYLIFANGGVAAAGQSGTVS